MESSNFARTNDMNKCKNCTFYKACEELKKYEKVSDFASVQMPKVDEVEYSDDDFPF
jgi:uncharacterized protein (UPF0179 family)